MSGLGHWFGTRPGPASRVKLRATLAIAGGLGRSLGGYGRSLAPFARLVVDRGSCEDGNGEREWSRFRVVYCTYTNTSTTACWCWSVPEPEPNWPRPGRDLIPTTQPRLASKPRNRIRSPVYE